MATPHAPLHNGAPIPLWSEAVKEYEVMGKFPQLQKRFETGLDCLSLRERLALQELCDKEDGKPLVDQALRDKVSLLAGGNLAHVAVDAVVNASNCWLSTGKEEIGKVLLPESFSLHHIPKVWLAICNLIGLHDFAQSAQLVYVQFTRPSPYPFAPPITRRHENEAILHLGVNGMIHSAAGTCLYEECQRLGGCDVGEAKITSGYNLPAKYVIHTVGPEGHDDNRAEFLRRCYMNSLQFCVEHEDIRTIAFPCISTGQYHYPSVEAGNVALSTVREWLATDNNRLLVNRIVFVTRKVRDEEVYSTLMKLYF